MTMLLAHPADEDLGRFVEGTLPDTDRAKVVAHIADCDECRILVVHSAEFIEPAKTESRKWWMGVAASLILVAAIGPLTFNHFRYPLAGVEKTYRKVPNRPLEARISGFPYTPRSTMRGSGDDGETDPTVLNLQAEAGKVLERSGDAPKILNAHGVAHLLVAATAGPRDNIDIPSERRKAIAELEAAANREPKNAGYQSDVAAALLSTGDPKQRDLAIVYLDKALAIDSRNPEALFNRALAFRASNPQAAIAAFKRYLDVDSTSPWAKEAHDKIDLLEPLTLP